MGVDPGLPGGRIPDLKPPAGRYLVAAALAILVAALTISIVLTVTGG
jgi:hypothetical protein